MDFKQGSKGNDAALEKRTWRAVESADSKTERLGIGRQSKRLWSVQASDVAGVKLGLGRGW